jgi:hypothetical protein
VVDVGDDGDVPELLVAHALAQVLGALGLGRQPTARQGATANDARAVVARERGPAVASLAQRGPGRGPTEAGTERALR